MHGAPSQRYPVSGSLLLILLAPSVWGCSLVVDSSREQCVTNFDCRERGLAFEEAMCVDNLCQVDPKWSCVGSVTDPPQPQEARDATLEVFDIYERTRPFPGVHASLHALLDENLANPLSAGDTDADGKVTLSIPAMFDGFVYLAAEGMVEPALFYPDLPLAPEAGLGRALIGGIGADDGVVRLVGEMPLEGRGSLFLELQDCAGGGGAGRRCASTTTWPAVASSMSPRGCPRARSRSLTKPAVAAS